MGTQASKNINGGSPAWHSAGPTNPGSVSPGGTFERNVPVYEVAPPETLDMLHQQTLRLLKELGIEFHDEQALSTWREAGARVEGSLVRIPPELLMKAVASAPGEYVQYARNPKRSIRIGGKNMAFMPAFGSTFVRDLEGIRRPSTLADFHDLVKLAYMSPSINYSGGVVCEPMDQPTETRHLDMLYAHFRYSDKPFMGNPSSAEIAQDCIEMGKIIFGSDFVASHVVMTTPVNCNSPRVWGQDVLEVIRLYAQNNQAVALSPFVLQGASTPITSAGALVQLNAEVLAGIAYMQLVNPGCPSLYGLNPTVVSMQTGYPSRPSSEAQLLTCVGAQLAKKYNVPVRTLAFRTDANELDVQAGYEAMQSVYPSLLAGCHYITHCAGWLEAAMSTCFAKFIMDAEQLTIVQRFLKGLDVDEETLAWETFEEVPPGGDYFTCDHTYRYFREAFYTPQTKIGDPYDKWIQKGSENAVERARDVARKLLEVYQPPSVEADIDEALIAYVSKRKTEIRAL